MLINNVPENIKEFKNPLLYTLYTMLIMYAATQDMIVLLPRGREIQLKKGQALFRRDLFGKLLGVSGVGAAKMLNRLEKLHNKVTCNKISLGTVVTIKDYSHFLGLLHNKVTCNSPNKSHNNSNIYIYNTNIYINNIHSRYKYSHGNNIYINKKEKGKNSNLQELEILVEIFNEVFGRRLSANKALINNYVFWREQYEFSRIVTAMVKAKYHQFWGDKMTPTILFRKKNTSQEPVSYIEQLLAWSVPVDLKELVKSDLEKAKVHLNKLNK